MTELNHRKPFALANWKMAMTIEEGRKGRDPDAFAQIVRTLVRMKGGHRRRPSVIQ